MVEVPAPSIFAPMRISIAARSTTSGSRAALSSTVSPLGQRRGHQQIFGAGDGDAVEVDLGALQSVRRGGFNVAVVLRDGRAQRFQTPSGGD